MLVPLLRGTEPEEHYEFVLVVCEEHEALIVMCDGVKPLLCSRVEKQEHIPWKRHVMKNWVFVLVIAWEKIE